MKIPNKFDSVRPYTKHVRTKDGLCFKTLGISWSCFMCGISLSTMVVSIHGGTPKIIHFNGIVPHKPSIFGYTHDYGNHQIFIVFVKDRWIEMLHASQLRLARAAIDSCRGGMARRVKYGTTGWNISIIHILVGGPGPPLWKRLESVNWHDESNQYFYGKIKFMATKPPTRHILLAPLISQWLEDAAISTQSAHSCFSEKPVDVEVPYFFWKMHMKVCQNKGTPKSSKTRLVWSWTQ